MVKGVQRAVRLRATLSAAALWLSAAATMAAAQAPGSIRAPPDPARVDSLLGQRMLQEAVWEARAVGDTARAEAILAELEAILRATPHHARPLSMDQQGVAYTFRAHHGAGIESAFKVDGSDIFCPECGADREVAAYQIDRLLGVDLAPVTVHLRLVHEGDTLSGSAMYWIRHAQRPSDAGKEKPDLLRFFDAVLGNSDRHPGNWLLTPHGRAAAIDHNRSFEYRPSTRTRTCWEAEVDSIADPAGLGAPFHRYRTLPAESLAAAVAGVTDAATARLFVEMRDRVVARIEARAADGGRSPPRVDCPAT